jgi:2-haloacid dehalogenase
MAVKAVVFDVGRVLYEWDRRHLFEKLIEDRQELDRFLDIVAPVEWHEQHDAGRPIDVMIEERIARFPDHELLLRAYRERWLETIPGPVPGVHALVEGLSRHGVPLFAITNFGADFWEMFRPTAPLFDHFGDIVVSGVEKMMKPDPAIYALALERFGLAPGEGLFVDDSLPNVEAARANGFVAHHFRDAEALRAELTALELLPRQPDDVEHIG